MPISLSWQQIGLPIGLALIASFLIGYDRDEHGKSTGIRTTMLVCLAATLAMLQASLLMSTRGKTPDSFVVLDLMRLPLGILSGIGFIGAGAIIRKDGLVRGLTTAATLWFVTVLGLIFGGGQISLGLAGATIAVFILWILKRVESLLPTQRTGSLVIEFDELSSAIAPTEAELRDRLHALGFKIHAWSTRYRESALRSIDCELRWHCAGHPEGGTPGGLVALASEGYVVSLLWRT